MTRKVLDVACGTRACWFDKNDSRAIFGDIRNETITVTDRTHKEDGTREIRVAPDVLLDFRNLNFPDETFRLVLFDPPHLLRAGPASWMKAKYGLLDPTAWREDLRQGFNECFRGLKPGGVLIFKWSETQVPLADALALTPNAPLFGHNTRNTTHWVTFIRPEAYS